MGTYFRGHLKYKHALTFALKRIQSQFKGRLILFLLHKIYPETQGCNKKCKEFNSHEKAHRFRTIQLQVAKHLNIETFDTYGMTDTEFARNDAADGTAVTAPLVLLLGATPEWLGAASVVRRLWGCAHGAPRWGSEPPSTPPLQRSCRRSGCASRLLGVVRA